MEGRWYKTALHFERQGLLGLEAVILKICQFDVSKLKLSGPVTPGLLSFLSKTCESYQLTYKSVP